MPRKIAKPDGSGWQYDRPEWPTVGDNGHENTSNDAITGDSVIVLSSEIIQGIVQAWFNGLFTRPVAIIDAKPTDTGYAFTITFGSQATKRDIS